MGKCNFNHCLFRSSKDLIMVDSRKEMNNNFSRLHFDGAVLLCSMLVENEPDKVALFQMLQRIQAKAELSVECFRIEENYYYLQMWKRIFIFILSIFYVIIARFIFLLHYFITVNKVNSEQFTGNIFWIETLLFSLLWIRNFNRNSKKKKQKFTETLLNCNVMSSVESKIE